MDNLNHENFWSKMHEENPHITDLFCKWIDEYKKRVGWNDLFNSNSEYQNAAGKNAKAPKFHDLPIEMQLGILDRFKQETSNGKELAESQCKLTVRKLEQWFYAMDLQIRNKKG